MSLGSRIVSMRRQKNWKQVELAEKLGVAPRQLVRWENDQSRPRGPALETIAKVLDTTVETLISEPSPQSLERIEDPELRELLSYIPEFGKSKHEALKILLRDMVTSHQVARVTSRHQKA